MEERKSRRRLAAGLLLVILLVGIGAVRVGKFLPTVGALDTPANTNISQYYISNAVADTHAHNIVTAVLADYRGFDTLFETCVMLLSGVAVWTILSAKEKVEKRTDKEMIAYYRTSIFGSMLMDGAFRIVVPIILIYGMYVLFHGEISLGGRFPGGRAAGLCLYAQSDRAEIRCAQKTEGPRGAWHHHRRAGSLLLRADGCAADVQRRTLYGAGQAAVSGCQRSRAARGRHTHGGDRRHDLRGGRNHHHPRGGAGKDGFR